MVFAVISLFVALNTPKSKPALEQSVTMLDQHFFGKKEKKRNGLCSTKRIVIGTCATCVPDFDLSPNLGINVKSCILSTYVVYVHIASVVVSGTPQ